MNIDRTIAEHQVNAKGWQVDLHLQGDGLNEQPFYLLHVESERLDLLTLPVDLREPQTPTFTDVDLASTAFAAAYRAYVKPGTAARRAVLANQLGGAVFNYLLNTESWRQLKGVMRDAPITSLHPILILYGPKRDLLMRPIIARSERRYESPEWVMKLCTDVIEQDRQRHPDWFR